MILVLNSLETFYNRYHDDAGKVDEITGMIGDLIDEVAGKGMGKIFTIHDHVADKTIPKNDDVDPGDSPCDVVVPDSELQSQTEAYDERIRIFLILLLFVDRLFNRFSSGRPQKQ